MERSRADAENVKKILSGLSPPASALLSVYVQDPAFSLSPYFLVFLLGGSVCFVICLGRFIEKKHRWLRAVWELAGVTLSGFVLVSWASYASFLASDTAAILVILAIALVCVFYRKRISRMYSKNRALVYLGLIACTALPTIGVIQHTGEKPVVVVSPSSSFVQLPEPGMEKSINITVASVYASAWDIHVTSNSSVSLATYLNGMKDGPVEIPYLQRNRQYPIVLRVQTTPRTPAETYEVRVNYDYRDAFGETHNGSTTIEIAVGEYVAFTYVPILLFIIIALVIMGIGIETHESKGSAIIDTNLMTQCWNILRKSEMRN